MKRRRIGIVGTAALLLAAAAMTGDSCNPWTPVIELPGFETHSQVRFNWGWAVARDGHASGDLYHVFRNTENPERETVANDGEERIFFRCWDHTANQLVAPAGWTDPELIPGIGDDSVLSHPKIAAAGEHVYVVFHGQLEGDGTLYVYLAHGVSSSEEPCEVDWDDDVLRVSEDDAGEEKPGAWPSVAAAGDYAHVVWYSNFRFDDEPHANAPGPAQEVYLRSLNVSTGVWQTATRVSSYCFSDGSCPAGYDTTTPGPGKHGMSSYTASVAADESAIHVAWTDERHHLDTFGQAFDCRSNQSACKEEEYYRRITIEGEGYAMGDEIRLTNDPANAPRESWAPSIALSQTTPQVVHLAYFDKRPQGANTVFQIYYRHWEDGNDPTLSSETILTSASPTRTFNRPSIAANGNRVAVAYYGTDIQGPGPWHVYLRRSTDGGGSFTAQSQLSGTEISGEGPHASVAVDADGRTHVVWFAPGADDVDQIFYRRRSP